ncbi:MAG: SsrA-binding protein SmpB [Dehalococcoidia bacterium]|nr:SsrA-binding protein SmpB [Dehalococcoidia bacterium]
MSEKIVSLNRKAYHDYDIQDSIEAGISLTGTEIKSIRSGAVNIRDAYAKHENGEMWLLNSHIARYDPGSIYNHEPDRRRKLLLHRKEINWLTGTMTQKGLTLIPLKLYLKKGKAKIELGLARGKKLHDKRKAIMERDVRRQIDQAIKQRR